jgi:hypothetical protein
MQQKLWTVLHQTGSAERVVYAHLPHTPSGIVPIPSAAVECRILRMVPDMQCVHTIRGAPSVSMLGNASTDNTSAAAGHR